MVTEIGARDFADPMRYNMLEVGYRCQHTVKPVLRGHPRGML